MKMLHIPEWAEHIKVRKKDTNTIEVVGENHYPFPGNDLISRRGHSEPDGGGLMHIEFANAETESELLRFLVMHGPVNGEMRSGELFPVNISHNGFKHLMIEQSMAKLRDAQQAIAAAARLVAGLQSENSLSLEASSPLCCRVGKYIGATLEDRSDWEKSGVLSKKTLKVAAKAEMSLGADLLCQFLDTFPPKLAWIGRHCVELPYYESDGILPVIGYLLRHEFISAERTVGICERCGRLFAVTRRGAQFCSAECSQLKRSLDYYHCLSDHRRQQYWAARQKAN